MILAVDIGGKSPMVFGPVGGREVDGKLVALARGLDDGGAGLAPFDFAAFNFQVPTRGSLDWARAATASIDPTTTVAKKRLVVMVCALLLRNDDDGSAGVWRSSAMDSRPFMGRTVPPEWKQSGTL